ncbi:glutamate receptor [Salix suchowensis]|nr:glutamate receptor [Salix suchowensis]
MGMAENISIPVNIGVVLDLGSDLDGKIALSCIEMALSDFYATHGDYRTRLVLNTRDSMKDVVGAAAAVLLVRVPIRSTYFVRATLNDSTQVNAISELVKTYKWREAVPIYMDNEYGEGIIPYLTDALQAVNARVPYRSVISPSATDDRIVVELYKLMGMQTRVFIVHMYGSLGTRIFAKAKEIGMMSKGYVWIMTDGLTADLLSSPNPSVTGTMQGVLGVKSYVPSTKELQDFRVRWKRKFQQDNPYIIDAELNIYGLRGYDAATALALAANGSSTSSTDLASLGASFNGPSLLQALSNTSFKGLTGNYHFVDGQLQSPAFQIVNVNGNGGREIGFWTPKKGLVKQLVPSNEECHELLSKGSGNGGIAAAFEEEPYMKVFLSKYCPKYTIIDALFKTGGFGFVFPKGSPLVPEISIEILNIIEGDKMKEIQDKWFGKQTGCPNSGTSNSLSIKTFWGLFLISGIAALLALIIFIVMFVHQEWRVVLGPSDSTTSIWSKIRHLFSIFNQRDLTSHAFRKSEADERDGIHLQSMGAASQSGNSDHTEFHGSPSSAGNTQSPRVVIIADQLANPNQESAVKENQKSNVNHQTHTRTIIHQRSKSDLY